MTVFFITLGAFGIVLVAMAIGVIFSDKPLSGSCGGIGKLFGISGCFVCEKKKRGECPSENKRIEAARLAEEAAKLAGKTAVIS